VCGAGAKFAVGDIGNATPKRIAHSPQTRGATNDKSRTHARTKIAPVDYGEQ